MATRTASPFALPVMFAELAMASWETVWHRTALMATGACTQAEYARMLQEKMAAVQQASLALLTGQDTHSVWQPFHLSATANARRLRGQ